MRPQQNKNRMRGKLNRRPGGGNHANIINRVFDSAGPEGKVRGTPQQLVEKYMALARDAATAGDRVMAENYSQHAEHYARLMLSVMPTPRREEMESIDAEEMGEGDEELEEGDNIANQPAPQPRELQPREQHQRSRDGGHRDGAGREGNQREHGREGGGRDRRHDRRRDRREESDQQPPAVVLQVIDGDAPPQEAGPLPLVQGEPPRRERRPRREEVAHNVDERATIEAPVVAAEAPPAMRPMAEAPSDRPNENTTPAAPRRRRVPRKPAEPAAEGAE